jgi:hypothetical protein
MGVVMIKKLFLIFLPFVIQAQFISVKSLPVVTGDQFYIYPSKNISMGSVSIALDDPWLDPFINPAKGKDIKNTQLFIQPTFYSIEENLGGARTFPVTLFTKYKDWFVVLSGSFQQLEAANTSNSDWFTTQPSGPADRYADNKYGYAGLGMNLPIEGFTVGGSIFLADLNAMSGVDLLYNNSVNISQDGDMLELRGGMYYHDKFSSFEAVGLYNNFEMLHKVSYWNWIWNEGQTDMIQQLNVEKNLDHTDTYGIHFKYREKFEEDGPAIGAMFTYNWKSHPKIPNYEIMNIPRDPGNTWAYNFGIGVGNDNELTRFGLEFIYAPVWSNTWANAQEEINTWNGGKILPGQKTVENNFTFNNWIARIGFGKTFKIYEFSVGLQLYDRSYTLDQYDYISQSVRTQDESWTEKIFSWGAVLHFSRFDLKYTGRACSGAGIPSVSRTGPWFDSTLRMEAADFIAAPSGSLSVEERTSVTHQFLVQIPLFTDSVE